MGKLYSLTNPQKSILLTEEYFKGTNINNICGTAIIDNELDFILLQKAISIFVKNHDSFHFKLVMDNNEMKQYVDNTVDYTAEIIDIGTKDDICIIENELKNHIFDIYNGDLFCIKVFRLSDNTGGFIVNIHHLFADSWTLGIVAKEIVRIYSCLLNDVDISNDDNFSYVNYIETEKEYLSSDKYIKDKEYWNLVFSTVPEQVSLPGSVTNSKNDFNSKANRLVFNIDTDLMNTVNEYCKLNHVSVFNFFMAVYAIYIGRVSRLDDFVIGTPILNRTNFKEKNTTGMFINTAPFRVNVDNSLSFKSFVSNIAKDSLGLLRHQKYYYQNILEDLRENNPTLPTLYNVLISYQVTKANTEKGLDYYTRWSFNENISDDIDIHLYDLNDSGSMDVAYDFKVCKFNSDDVVNMHNRILHIINQVVGCDNICLKDIEIVTKEEKNKILYEFNNFDNSIVPNKTIIDLFEEQVKKTPNKTAVVFYDNSLTYEQLNIKANKLANYLLKYNINTEDCIGIFLDKSLEMIVSILAILKVGACYVPIDIYYPKSRIDYMLQDSKAKLILSSKLISQILDTDLEVINIDLDNDFYNEYSNIFDNTYERKNTDLAYVMYTSGSTGTPKGVMIENQSIVRLVKDTNYINFNENDRILQTGSIVFDACTFEIWGALLNGLELYLIKKEDLLTISIFEKFLIDNKISILWLTAPLFNQICEQNAHIFKNVRCLLTGGDVLSPKHINMAKNANPNLTIINGYGPTENTTFSCCFPIHNIYTESIPIGKPITNSSCYVVSNSGSLQPIGIPGELWVGGIGVARGYLNNESLTNKVFLNNTFGNSRVYKTGDLVKWLPDGNIEFIGRIDNQVKIRGFRIELNEINYKILSFDDVKESITLVDTNNNGDKFICSYVVFKTNKDVSALKDFLKKNLPHYMVPTFIVALDVLPINTNGKVDKTLLPTPTFNDDINIIKPRNDLDIRLIDILRSLLNIDIVNISDCFTDLGGDSLSAINFSSIILKDFGVNISIKDILMNTSIMEISDMIQNQTSTISDIKICPAIKDTSYPLSSGQKRIYYACKMIGDSTLVYNITGALVIDKVLDKDRAINAFKHIIQRHSAFRTSFVIVDDEVKQTINDNVNFEVPVFNSSSKDLDTILSSFQKPFDLENDVLLRVNIHYLDNEKTLLLIDSHHIVIDGLSLNIFIDEFCKLYNNESLENLEIDYKDFAVWENDYINSDSFKDVEDYWINKFKNSEIPSLNLPYDFPSAPASYCGDRILYKMDKNIFEHYIDYAKNLHVSPYVLFLSTYLILLHKYTSQEEVIVGSPTVGRNIDGLNNLIGMFVNNIVIDAKIRSKQTFIDFVNYIKAQVLDDLNHQSYPYDLLVKKLANLNNRNYRNSLFDVAFTYQNMPRNDFRVDGFKVNTLDIYSETAKFKLLLEINPETNTFSLEYNASLFKKETVESILEHYLYILDNLLNNSTTRIDDIDIITEKEKNLLAKFNNTEGEINTDTFVSIFEKQVSLHPNDIAIICNNKTLTYDELNKKANSLAHLLIKRGIGKNDIVCIMTNRSFETIICMLAILKSGAAFFNVDPTYPIERTKYYISDSNTKYVLTQKELKDKVKEIENCIEIDLNISSIYDYNTDNPNIDISADDLSYIIYTSGSTGTPKGVMLNQVGLSNMVKAMTKVLDYLKEGNKHTIASVTSTPFDIFVYEIVVSLAHGLKVVMATNAEHRNPKLLDALIRRHNVDVMTVTPSLMKINYDNREPDTALALVKNMVFGGEPLPEKFVSDLRALADDITIYNIYGPSEITVLSNVQNLDGEKEITVGPPIMNTQIHILDKNMKPVPIGVVGEIYISGIQVGLGYIGKEELTAERFMDNPFGPGRIYKSGDIGRWTFDGKVQCLGRVDHQIKLRGLRIELGEIENVMVNVDGVTASVVNKIEIDGKDVLCGYFVADASVSESTVKDALRSALPYYMVPTYVIRLDEMPYTINRKIDRKALPLPEPHRNLAINKININKLNSNEEKLLQIWKNILKIQDIDINDNFFDIGGDSISAISMQIEAIKYGLNFEYADIFNYPTIKLLSHKLPRTDHSFIDNYDYTTVNKVLARNNISNISTIKDANVKNILLIGSTGYLGVHILDAFMKENTGTIYCLIRPKDNVDSVARLKEFLNFYFDGKYIDEFGKRIIILEGDIVQNNLGLSIDNYQLLKENVDVVINSGALVKHFGIQEKFDNVNVLGTQNIVDFCKKEKKRLLHISTMSVSGNGEKEETVEENDDNKNNKVLFTETDLYIRQHVKNVYTTTKFRAELIVLEEIAKGLDAQILRLGNITNRYSDGVFQLNIENNAFAKRIQSFIEIGAIPRYTLKHKLELTPVDLAANAIIKVLNHTSVCNVFHIYNPKLLAIKLLLEVFDSLNIELIPVPDRLMSDIITGIMEDENRKEFISGIIHDLDNNKKLIYTSNIRLCTDFTVSYLKALGFEWKELDEDYIIKYMNYFKKIKFIDFGKEI